MSGGRARRVRWLAGGLAVVASFLGCDQILGNTAPVTVLCDDQMLPGCQPCAQDDECGRGACCSGVCVDPQSDAANCGGCGHGCQGQPCNAGACPELVWVTSPSPSDPIVDLAADTASLYWATASTLQSAPLDAVSTPASTPLVTGQAGILRLTTDGSFVYWIVPGSVSRVDVAGAMPPQPIVTRGAQKPGGLALGGSDVYWTNSCDGTTGGAAGCCSDGTVWKAAGDGTGQVAVAPFQDCPLEIAASGASSFWVNSNPSADIVCTPGDAGVQPLGGVTHQVSHLAADATYLYYADQTPTGHTILRVKLDLDPSTRTLVAAHAGQVEGLAVRGGHVFWTVTDGGGCSVLRGTAGAAPITLASAAASTCGRIAVTDQYAYWVRSDGGASEIARVSAR